MLVIKYFNKDVVSTLCAYNIIAAPSGEEEEAPAEAETEAPDDQAEDGGEGDAGGDGGD